MLVNSETHKQKELCFPPLPPTFQCHSSHSKMQNVCVCPGQNTLYLYTYTRTLNMRGSVLTEEFRCLKLSFHNTPSALEGNAAPLLPARRGQLSPPAWAPMQQAAKQGTALCQHTENLAVKLTSNGDYKDSSVDSHP